MTTTKAGQMGGRNPTRRGGVNRSRRAVSTSGGARTNPTSFASDKRKYDSYMARARDAASVGDLVEAENMYQHAEHFLRQMQD